MKKPLLLLATLFTLFACTYPQSTQSSNSQEHIDTIRTDSSIKVGAEATDKYFPLIEGKRVAVLTNQTGVVKDEHLVDMLKHKGFDLVGIFSPEIGRAHV